MTYLVSVTRKNCDAYLDGILEIENVSFPSPWSHRSFLQEVENPISHLWALTVDGFISGYISFWMFDSEIQLINIAVHPDRRSQGLGHLLLARMIEKGVSKGMRYIWLEVRLSNLAAQRLYQKAGFESVGRRPRYYRDTNEDAIIMSLSLTERVHYGRLSN
jgi:ribosomal-protein-alanine N-acetyltransferase